MPGLLACFLQVYGCGSGSKAVYAAANVAIGVAVLGVRRANGDCYTWCGPNTRCNRATGFCEASTCGKKCSDDEHCDVNLPVPACVPRVKAPTIMESNDDPYLGPILWTPLVIRPPEGRPSD